ncbi:MAG: aspartate--tRNA(Asn) ligase [archaeon]
MVDKEAKRVLIKDITPADFGKEIVLKGWVKEIRDLSKVKFMVLRDISGVIQVTGVKSETPPEVFDLFSKIPHESSVEVVGKVKESKQAPGGREILPDSIKIIGKSELMLPIDVTDYSKTELPKRLDNRAVDFHSARTQAIFKIQSEISYSFQEFFKSNGFMQIQPPSIISSASEGGTELFPVKYFEKNAYLAQSPQLYKQMAACSFEKVFCITPVWRAEKHNTIRHLNESRQMDIEVAFEDEFGVMKYITSVVQHMVKKVKENCKKELELLKVEVEVPAEKYLTFQETVDLLKKNGVEIDDDISPEGERKLCELFPNTVLLVHDWSRKVKPFYIMPKTLDEDEMISKGFDALYGGIEISSGGQRVHLPELLIEQLKMKGLNPDNFKSYVDSFRYGAPIHSGWSIGLERFTMALLELDNIREACLFPRDRDRLTP